LDAVEDEFELRVSPPELLRYTVSSEIPQDYHDISPNLNDISIATYNVDEYKQGQQENDQGLSEDERINALVKLLLQVDFDIICLQEMSFTILKRFMIEPRIVAQWTNSGEQNKLLMDVFRKRHVMTFYRKNKVKEAQVSIIELSSQDGRYLEVSQIRLWNEKIITILNVHLESMSYGDKRRHSQLKEIYNYVDVEDLKSRRPSLIVLAGDLNLSQPDEVADTFVEKYGWTDSAMTLDFMKPTWGVLYPCHFEPTRFDRILTLYNHKSEYNAQSMGLWGHDSIYTNASGQNRYVSDHLGVSVMFSLSHGGSNAIKATETVETNVEPQSRQMQVREELPKIPPTKERRFTHFLRRLSCGLI